MNEQDIQPFPSEINWQQLWEELDWDDRRRRQAIQARLQQRAEQFAREPAEVADEGAPAYRMLAFRLGAEQYGADAMLVRIVRTVQKITPVPGTPPFYRGVCNIRGKIITVMDLRYFLGMPVDPADSPQELLVIAANNLEIGILAHHVHDVVTIPVNAVEILEDMRFTFGMAPGRLVLLDFARMFEDERLIIGDMDE